MICDQPGEMPTTKGKAKNRWNANNQVKSKEQVKCKQPSEMQTTKGNANKQRNWKQKVKC